MRKKQDVKIRVVLPKFTPEQLQPLIDFVAEHLAEEFIREEYEKRRTQEMTEKTAAQQYRDASFSQVQEL